MSDQEFDDVVAGGTGAVDAAVVTADVGEAVAAFGAVDLPSCNGSVAQCLATGACQVGGLVCVAGHIAAVGAAVVVGAVVAAVGAAADTGAVHHAYEAAGGDSTGHVPGDTAVKYWGFGHAGNVESAIDSQYSAAEKNQYCLHVGPGCSSAHLWNLAKTAAARAAAVGHDLACLWNSAKTEAARAAAVDAGIVVVVAVAGAAAVVVAAAANGASGQAFPSTAMPVLVFSNGHHQRVHVAYWTM